MAKKRGRSVPKPQKVIRIAGEHPPTEEEVISAELGAKVDGYLDELDRRTAAARKEGPGITDEQVFKRWVLTQMAVFETMLEEMANQIEAERLRD
jgi:hypothetical protein